MDIDKLLADYFEGKTSYGEERRLRAYFASGEVRGDLRKYKPLFAYFDEEAEKPREVPAEIKKMLSKHSARRIWLYALAGAAACWLLILGWGHYSGQGTRFCGENYVVINGHCYTDIHKVRSFALEALQEVSSSDESSLPEGTGETANGKEIIEDQLKEFSFLLDKD
ncbi:hypothetical protein [Parabacteroides sp. Marseille-P3160]|uniref:hypothetical protein n=1 Tax=Parabacteroides sp. Marseille-P3160 TaxID=1917887 RepID=UPI0009BB111B|nr:hypothetical protein [Parabacteroides sp. Marseille-P3160]